MPNRNEIAATVIKARLTNAKLGVIVRKVPGINAADVIGQIANDYQLLHVALADTKKPAEIPNVVWANSIEKAVQWRNQPKLAGNIIVFADEDLKKMNSLADFDLITTRDISTHILRAEENISSNEPQTRFWAAMVDEAGSFPLSFLEAFVDSVADGARSELIPKNLWHLGLLPDPYILDANKLPRERLQRNRDLLTEMRQLSESSRRRMSLVLKKALPGDQEKMRAAFRNLMLFFMRGENPVLQHLDVPTVEVLVKAGRQMQISAPVIQPTPAPEDSPELEPDTQPSSTESWQGSTLRENVASALVNQTEEGRALITEIALGLKNKFQEGDYDTAIALTSSTGHQGIQVVPEFPDADLRRFINKASTDVVWGGVLRTDREDLIEAISSFEQGTFEPLNPFHESSGAAGQSLFSILSAFQLGEGHPDFASLISDFAATRKNLAQELDLLLTDPFVLFGGVDGARESLDEYIAAYTSLVRTLRQHTADLSEDIHAYRIVVAGLLRLDVIHVKTPTEWKAILTPLHPFHLWRFREIFSTITNPTSELDEIERKQLSEALSDLPHLLHFVVFGADVTSKDNVTLPLSGTIGSLPTYENHTNRYLGSDGVARIEGVLDKWIEEAPYSAHQIRIACVDLPDIPMALRCISKFLERHGNVTILLDAYFTKETPPNASLIKLDFDNKDFKLADDLRNKKIIVLINSKNSLSDVVTSMTNKPVHVAVFFDQSEYQINTGPRAKQLLVSPLVMSFEYQFSDRFKMGTISPSSEAQSGLFSDYHYLVEQGAFLPAGQQIRLQYTGSTDLDPLNSLLSGEAARWLVLADRDLSAYRPQGGIPLSEERSGQREIAVWSKVSARRIRRFADLLRGYNLDPDENTVVELLRRFGHVASGGLLSIHSVNSAVRESREKGLIGTLIAAAWYTTKYPGSLIASLDSVLARQWLQMRTDTNERADLIGFRLNGDGLVVEPIEVKTRATNAEVRVSRDGETGLPILSGKAIEQLEAMRNALAPIFEEGENGAIFTAARREVLKYQVYRECFRDVHDPQWQAEWFRYLQRAFAITDRSVSVTCEAVVVHVQLEENIGETVIQDGLRPIRLVNIGTAVVNPFVSALAPEEPPGLDHNSASNDAGVSNEEERNTIPKQVPTFQKSAVDKRKNPEKEPSTVTGQASTTNKPTSHEAFADERIQTSSGSSELAKGFLRACLSYRIGVEECDPAKAIEGPTVTRFYIKLRLGQRLDSLRAALEDIGREMSRSGLMISALPNSDKIALDIPLLQRKIVFLSDVIETIPIALTPEVLQIPIGMTPEGAHIIEDLGKLPHLLVGGTTGAGKTVFLYGILMALMHTHPDPRSLRIFLSTSGIEDFSFFDGLPFLESGKVIADANQAIDALQNNVTRIFDERATILADAHCRDIGEYNSRHELPLPPLIVIVDEFADLADQLSGDKRARELFYTNIRRIAQIGRKRGVHLVLCTQRPSADLVPTNIRTLLNGRVALKVNDSTASRMILDEGGAENLQMHGDLLFSVQSMISRAQGYYINTPDLLNRIARIKGNY